MGIYYPIVAAKRIEGLTVFLKLSANAPELIFALILVGFAARALAICIEVLGSIPLKNLKSFSVDPALCGKSKELQLVAKSGHKNWNYSAVNMMC